MKHKLEYEKYIVAVHEPHPSGIGDRFVKYITTATKPTYETHWFDCTNGEWAITNPTRQVEPEMRKMEQQRKP